MAPNAKVPSQDNFKRLKGFVIHHVHLRIELKKKMDQLGLESHLKYPGAVSTKYDSSVEFMVDKLKPK